MKLRRYSFIAFAALVFAAPAFAGEHVDLTPGSEVSPGSGGVTTGLVNVLISDVDSGLPIAGASGTLWSIPKNSWEPPVIVDTAVSGRNGYLYMNATGYRGGDVFTLNVTAPNYAAFSTLLWLSKANTTHSEVDIAVTQSGLKQGAPSSVKGTVASTWGQIKSLY